MSDPADLRNVIHERHNLHCTHIRTYEVEERAWSRTVHICSCMDDSSMLVYAWVEANGGQQYAVHDRPREAADQ